MNSVSSNSSLLTIQLVSALVRIYTYEISPRVLSRTPRALSV